MRKDTSTDIRKTKNAEFQASPSSTAPRNAHFPTPPAAQVQPSSAQVINYVVSDVEHELLHRNRFKGPYEDGIEFIDRAAEGTIQKLLQHIAFGEQAHAEAMIAANPNLLTQSGTVKDLAGRVFTDVSPIQKAVWDGDWYMWEMIEACSDNAEIQLALIDQLQALEENGLGEHGKRYDWEVKTELSNYSEATKQPNLDWNILGNQWKQDVGGAQKRSTAFLINQYCHSGRGFFPTPDVAHERNMPRKHATSGGEWVCTELASIFGYSHGDGRSSYPPGLAWWSVWAHPIRRGMRNDVRIELLAVEACEKMSNQKYNGLIEQGEMRLRKLRGQDFGAESFLHSG